MGVGSETAVLSGVGEDGHVWVRQLRAQVCLRTAPIPVSLQGLLYHLSPYSLLVSSTFSGARGLAWSPVLSFPATITNWHQFLGLRSDS